MSFFANALRSFSGTALDTSTDEAKDLANGGTLDVSSISQVKDIMETGADGSVSIEDVQKTVAEHGPEGADDIAALQEKAEDYAEEVKDAVQVAQIGQSLAASDSWFANTFLKLVTCCGGPFAKIFGVSPADKKFADTAVQVQEALKAENIVAQ